MEAVVDWRPWQISISRAWLAGGMVTLSDYDELANVVQKSMNHGQAHEPTIWVAANLDH